MVLCLGLCAFTAKSLSSIPGQGTKIPQATSSDQLKKKKKTLDYALSQRVNSRKNKCHRQSAEDFSPAPPCAAAQLWASSLTSLCQTFLFYEMGKLLPISQVK